MKVSGEGLESLAWYTAKTLILYVYSHMFIMQLLKDMFYILAFYSYLFINIYLYSQIQIKCTVLQHISSISHIEHQN